MARLLVLAVALSWLAVGPAVAAEPPVMIDNFAGAVLGTRTVTGLPSPDQGTTPPGTFSQSGGVGRVNATGNGNRPGGVQLDYAFPSTDLRAGKADTRFLVEFASIDRQPEPPAPQGAVAGDGHRRRRERRFEQLQFRPQHQPRLRPRRSASTVRPGPPRASAATPTFPSGPT